MWLKQDKIVKLVGSNNTTMERLVPRKVYLLKTESNKFFLEEMPSFKIPEKLYGGLKEQSIHYAKRHEELNKSMGILLLGKKGNGKTMLGKMIALQRNIPIILINERFYDISAVSSFISNLGEPCVIFLDEYDKTYSGNDDLLSVLDGTNITPHLWILTSNESHHSEWIKNRPSRVRYVVSFNKISIKTAEELIDDLLIITSEKADLLKACEIYSINLDLLIELIKEVNDTGFSVKEILKTFNVDIEDALYSYTVVKDGEETATGVCRHHPLSSSGEIIVQVTNYEKNIKQQVVQKNSDFWKEATYKIVDGLFVITYRGYNITFKSLLENERFTF